MNIENKISLKNLDYSFNKNICNICCDLIFNGNAKHVCFTFETVNHTNSINFQVNHGYNIFLPLALIYAFQTQSNIYVDGQIPYETMYMLNEFLIPVFTRVLDIKKIELKPKAMYSCDAFDSNKDNKVYSIDLTRKWIVKNDIIQNLIDSNPNSLFLLSEKDSNIDYKKLQLSKTHTLVKCRSNISDYLHISKSSINLIESISYTQCLSNVVDRCYLPATTLIDNYKVDFKNLEKSELMFAHCFTLPNIFIDVFGCE